MRSRSQPAVNAADTRLAAEMRALARHIFQGALAASTVQKAFDQHVNCSRGVLRVCDDLYHLGAYPRVFVVSLGKAAHTMVEALAGQVGGGMSGIVASSMAPESQAPGFRYFQGGHPVPNHESLRAGAAILKALQAQDARALVLYLLSGGGSSIVEQPIADEIALEDLVATYRQLVLSGAPIAEINAIRKHLSAVKGGRMAQAAGGAQQVSIMVSDVPPDALDVLASGPTMPDSTSVEDCYRIAQKYELVGAFPGPVRALFERRGLAETPKPGDPAFARSRWWPVLSSATVARAAAAQAAGSGFAVETDDTTDDWDYVKAADYLLQRLRERRQSGSRACLLTAGEVTVQVAGTSGAGGRNQQFALYCAEKIAGENITVLSAGTDGVDGNSPAAGAVVDGTTLARARAAGFELRQALERFDAFPLFEKLGDTIVTGPTGNNLRDLRLLLAY